MPKLNDLVAAEADIERLNAEIAEWKQAAGVEAGLRREFLARAELAEEKLANTIAAIRALPCPFEDGPLFNGWTVAKASCLNFALATGSAVGNVQVTKENSDG